MLVGMVGCVELVMVEVSSEELVGLDFCIVEVEKFMDVGKFDEVVVVYDVLLVLEFNDLVFIVGCNGVVLFGWLDGKDFVVLLIVV